MDDALMLLTLQLEWGADEAIGPSPIDRLAATAPPARRALEATAPEKRTLRETAPEKRTLRETAPERRTIATPPASAVGSGVVARACVIAEACTDLAGLQAATKAFDGCPLRDTAGHLVFADGPQDARLMVVVEAPGAEDDEAGRPLSGRQGALLDAMLGSVGVPRASVRTGCLVPWRPPGGRPPTPIEIAACKPFLRAHIRLLPGVTHLVLFGATVARALTDAEGQMRQLRGRWLTVGHARGETPALVMAPLDMIASDARQKAAAWSDLIGLRRALDAVPITSE